MGLMCKIGSKCCATKGMCPHEKMMLLIAIIAMPAAGYYFFHWF